MPADGPHDLSVTYGPEGLSQDEYHDAVLDMIAGPDFVQHIAPRQPFKISRPDPPLSKEENIKRKNREARELKAKEQAATSTPSFQLWPRSVSSDFRQLLVSMYPALESPKHAPALRRLWKAKFPKDKAPTDTRAYWRIAQYALFSGNYDIDTRQLLFSQVVVAALVEVPLTTRGFKAQEWITAFSQDVFPLNPTEYKFTESRVRTIDPEPAPEIIEAMLSGKAKGNDTSRLDFVTGQPISVRAQRSLEREEQERQQALFDAVDADHPARELLEFLHKDKGHYLARVLKQNWPSVQEAVDAMPATTEHEVKRKRLCRNLVARLDPDEKVIYKAVRNTPRIYVDGASIHQLPREIRERALAGAVELDLTACQLAVVAKVWDIPELEKPLRRFDFWDDLLFKSGLEPTDKPAIKTTIYSIIFGMSQRKLRQRLAEGDGLKHQGIGVEATKRFFQHRYVKALLKARQHQQEIIGRQGGGTDAFGRFQKTPFNLKTRVDGRRNPRYGEPNVPAALAGIVQSYELRLMLALLPILKSNQQIYLLSWLHDGVTVAFGNSTKAQAQIRRMKRAVEAEAKDRGIVTRLNHSYL